MLNNPTLDKLHALKLTGMAEAFSEQLQKPLSELDFEERLGLLVEREYILRDNRKMARRLKQAKLQQNACMEDMDYKHPRGLNKAAFLELFRCQWVQQHLNLLITGPTGCGKTYIACALAHKACLTGLTARYFRLPRLWNELKIAKANGSYSSWLAAVAKVDVLILDDWGLVAPDEEQRRDLLEILEDRYQNRSTMITSQLDVNLWHEHLGDATLADAVLDRLVHNAIRIQMNGDSMRRKSLQTNGG